MPGWLLCSAQRHPLHRAAHLRLSGLLDCLLYIQLTNKAR